MCNRAGELNEGRGRGRGGNFEGLRSAPGIEDGNLMDAGNGAAGRAAFFREEFAAAMLVRILRERVIGYLAATVAPP